MSIHYHQATRDDIEELLPLLVDMHEENGLCSLDIYKTVDEVEHVIDTGLCLLACDDEKIVGALAVSQETFWYSSDIVVRDRWFYVTPSYRKTRIAQTLLKYIREYAKQNKLPLMLGVTTRVDAVRKDKLYRGMTFYGSAWGDNFPET